MSETGSTPNGRPRRARIAVPFAVGAIAGATVIGGVALVAHDDGSGAGVGALAAATPGTAIASKAQSLSAEQIYRQDSPGVVDISVTTGAASQNGVSPFGPSGGSAQAEGTGFVYDTSGNIVTASHVVDGATAIQVRFEDGSVAKATLVGTDPSSDTAVINVKVASSKLRPLALADSGDVQPGQGAVAIGSPFGYEESITAGIVSAVDRSIEAPNGYSIPNAIQTDAPINHGNSGGPLIDAGGKVMGVNVQIAADDSAGSSQNAGVGFAVPSNTVKRVVDDLVAGRTVAARLSGRLDRHERERHRRGRRHRAGGRPRRGSGRQVRRRHRLRERQADLERERADLGGRGTPARRQGDIEGAARRLDPHADRDARHAPGDGSHGLTHRASGDGADPAPSPNRNTPAR